MKNFIFYVLLLQWMLPCLCLEPFDFNIPPDNGLVSTETNSFGSPSYTSSLGFAFRRLVIGSSIHGSSGNVHEDIYHKGTDLGPFLGWNFFLGELWFQIILSSNPEDKFELFHTLHLLSKKIHAQLTSYQSHIYAHIFSFMKKKELNKLLMLTISHRVHRQKIPYVIAAGANVNFQNKEGYTPLTLACKQRLSDIVDLLLDANADVNKKNKQNFSPLMIACSNEHLFLVEQLLKSNADVYGPRDYSPLSIACQKGAQKIVSLLLKKNASVNVRFNQNGETPLMLASEYGSLEIVRMLIKKKADINTITIIDKQNALNFALDNGHLTIAKFLIKKGSKIRISDSHISSFCKHGEYEILSFLLKKKPKIKNKIQFNLMSLLEKLFGNFRYSKLKESRINILRLFVDNGLVTNQVNMHGQTPLIYASLKAENKKIIQLLIDAGIDINKCCKDGTSALFYLEMPSTLQMLINNGADVNHTNKYGNTPLIYACRPGIGGKNKEKVKILLAFGAQVNHKNKNGKSALWYALKYRDASIVKLLLNAGAHLNHCNNRLTTTQLFYYILKNWSFHGLEEISVEVEILELLIKAGANINEHKDIIDIILKTIGSSSNLDAIELLIKLLNKNGLDYQSQSYDINNYDLESEILGACEHGNKAIIEFLIKIGANFDFENYNGETPSGKAQKKEIVMLLASAKKKKESERCVMM